MPAPPISPLPPEPPAAPPTPAPAPAAAGAPASPPRSVELEFDGSITDVADVAVADFPVLTDAVEPAKRAAPAPAKAAQTPAAAPQAKAASPAAAAATAPAAPAAPKPAAKPASRLDTAPFPRPAPKPPAAPQPTTTPLPHAAGAKAASGAAACETKGNDLARQTHAVRAIADAKSLDDISDIDAETLFGDAELDLVSAALASAADWPDDDEPTGKPTPALTSPPPATSGKSAAPSTEDGLDLFGLDADAPLELIDDSTLPPANPRPKTAVR
jgi:hypothetical protein